MYQYNVPSHIRPTLYWYILFVCPHVTLDLHYIGTYSVCSQVTLDLHYIGTYSSDREYVPI
jgi:hypothetical protein